jgi:hypothetical protein
MKKATVKRCCRIRPRSELDDCAPSADCIKSMIAQRSLRLWPTVQALSAKTEQRRAFRTECVGGYPQLGTHVDDRISEE